VRSIVGGLLALALVAFLSYPAGAAVTFSLSYSDPASDVVQLWASNMTPVLDGNGDVVMSPFPDAINILWLRSRETDGGASVNVSIEVKGNVADLENTTYTVRLYTDASNASHFVLEYRNGRLSLWSNATPLDRLDLSGNTTVASTGPNPTLANLLEMRVNKTHLAPLTAWNVEATALMVGSPYAYRDFGWEVPGSPGSSPTAIVGRVRDAATGEALVGATVATEIGGYAATTNATGGYALVLPAGVYNVTVSMAGYLEQRFQVTVAAGETVTLNANLAPVQPSSLLPLYTVLLLVLAGGTAALLWLSRRRASR
jgi:hypothetical protein